MNNKIRTMTTLAAAVMLTLAPAGAFAANPSTSTPTAAPESVHAAKEHMHPHNRDKTYRAGGHFIINETAKLLEMDRSALVDSLKSGTTLYALAREKKGWSEEQYIQKLSEAASRKLDESIKDGKLTKDEAAKLKAGLPAMIKLSLSHTAHYQQVKPSQQPAAPESR